MAAPLTISQAADLVDKSIQNIWLKSSTPENQYSKFFNVRTTEDYYEKDSSLSGLGEASFTNENSVIVSDIPVQGYDKTYTQAMVALLLPITFRMWKFGIKRRMLTSITTELKKAVERKKEKLCAERLDNGFESTSYTHLDPGGSVSITTSGGDSLGAFDDDHTREDGGTNMNNYVYDGTTYNLPFDYAGLKGAHRTASLMVAPRGNPRPATLDTLVVKKGTANHFKAMEILGAIKSGKIPESMDNDGAAVSAFKVLPLDYLTNTGYWYMFDGSRALTDREGFQFVESQSVSLDPTNVVYKTKELQVSVTCMFDLGHNDVARSWVASKGDSSSPSD